MRLLLDTHILIWLATDQGELSATERCAIADADTELLVSAVSIWELRVKDRAERRRGRAGFVLIADRGLAFCRDMAIDVVALEADDALIVLDPQAPNFDPFDEMLLAHAQRLGARLLTRDDPLLHHPLAYQP